MTAYPSAGAQTWLRRVGWLVLIWTGSVLALGVVGVVAVRQIVDRRSETWFGHCRAGPVFFSYSRFSIITYRFPSRLLPTNHMKGGGINHPPRCRLVEPDAMRVACPCSMEALPSNPTKAADVVGQTLPKGE